MGHCFSIVSFFVQSGCNLKVRRFLSSRASLTPARAGAFKVGRRTNLAACSALARPYLDGSEHTLVRSGRRSEGSPLSGAVQSRHNLVSGRSKDPNHDAVMRIGSEAPKRRTHSSTRRESQGASPGYRHLEPSSASRHKRTDKAKTVVVPSASSVHCAGRKTTPSGTMPSRTSRHRAISSLRAKATIMGFRVPRAFSVRDRNHFVKALSFWCRRNRHAN